MEIIKYCKDCKTNKEVKDFLGKEICYKCLYAIKKKKIPRRLRQCKQCKTNLGPKRWAYCSDECAALGKTEYVHWSQKCIFDNKDYKKRFNPAFKRITLE